jgi:hypothetical protein
MDVTLDDTLDLLLKWGLVVKDTGTAAAAGTTASSSNNSSSSSSGGTSRYHLRPLPEAVRRLKAQSLLQRVMQIQDHTGPDDADTPSSSGARSSSSSAGSPLSGASDQPSSQAHSGQVLKQPAGVTAALAGGGGCQQHHTAAGAAVAVGLRHRMLPVGVGLTAAARRMHRFVPRAFRATGGRSCMCARRLLV